LGPSKATFPLSQKKKKEKKEEKEATFPINQPYVHSFSLGV